MHGSTRRLRQALVLLACLIVVTVAVTPVSAAPGTSSCGGDGYTTVRRSDGTAFATRKDCQDYVKTGGTLLPGPRIVIELLVRFTIHCEVDVLLQDFPASVNITTTLDRGDGVATNQFQTDASGALFAYHLDGTPFLTTGFGFGLGYDEVAHVTVTYAGAGGSGTVSTSYTCPKRP